MQLRQCRDILGKMVMMKTYSELIKLPTFLDRFKYLELHGKVANETFGWNRWLNQDFYRSKEWKSVRNKVILRDKACDLGMEGFDIPVHPIVHHINPITEKDLINAADILFNPENLITVSEHTHNAIHYGDESLLDSYFVVNRAPNDTCPWK